MKHVIAISVGLMLAMFPLSCKKADDGEQVKLESGTPLAVGPMRSMDASEAEFIKRNAEKIIAGESVIPPVDEEVAAAAAAPSAGPGGMAAGVPGDMGGPGGVPGGPTAGGAPGGMPGAAAPGGMPGMPGAPAAPTAPPAPAPRPGGRRPGGPADANDAGSGALW